ncbi:MAG: hypothetical protein EOM67_12295 [Spirochaetia bacterium]|nr:hypothetical protein [Spirochaetia bacterium]
MNTLLRMIFLVEWTAVSKLLKELLGPMADPTLLILTNKMGNGEDISPVLKDIFARYRHTLKETTEYALKVPTYADGLYPSDIMFVNSTEVNDKPLVPLLGLKTLSASRCGKCSNVYSCFPAGKAVEIECVPNELNNPKELESFEKLPYPSQFFDDVLQEMGLERQSWQNLKKKPQKQEVPIYVTDLIKYVLKKAPTEEQIIISKKWLELEALFVQPKVTILLGNAAHKALNPSITLEFAKGLKNKKEASQWYYVKPPFGLVFTTNSIEGKMLETDILQKLIQHSLNYIALGVYPHQNDNPHLEWEKATEIKQKTVKELTLEDEDGEIQ